MSLKKNFICNLPNDCIAKVIEFLTYKETLLSFEYICKEFYNISSNCNSNYVWNCKLAQYFLPMKDFLEDKIIKDVINIEVFNNVNPRELFKILKAISNKSRMKCKFTEIIKLFNERIFKTNRIQDIINGEIENFELLLIRFRYFDLFGRVNYDDSNEEYIGQLLHNTPHGRGKSYHIGFLYAEGEFLNGFIHGKAIQYHINGKIKFEGTFSHGEYKDGKLYDFIGNLLKRGGYF